MHVVFAVCRYMRHTHVFEFLRVHPSLRITFDIIRHEPSRILCVVGPAVKPSVATEGEDIRKSFHLRRWSLVR